MTLLDLFDAAVADRASAPAVGDLSYGELQRAASRVAAALRALGIRPGERIVLCCENRLGFVFAYLGALRCGAVVVPANVLYRDRELAHVVNDSGASVAIVSAATRERFVDLGRGCRLLAVEDIEVWARDGKPDELPVRVRDEDLAWIIYTSGTTGRPKGAMLSHGAVAAIAAQLVASWRWRADDVLVSALPLFHMHGLGAALNGTLAAGARLVLHERFDPVALMTSLREQRATMFFGVPTMYVRLLEHAGAAPALRLRLWVSGSAALSPAVHAAFEERFGAPILERYGASEFGFALTNRYGGLRVPGSVGIPTPGTRVRIVSQTDGSDVAAGETGELQVAGPTVFQGYWNAAEATAAAFAFDGCGTRWYRSGDLARYDAERDVYRIVGRCRELIVSGGFNVYPREVEDEIERRPGVRAAAVIGIPDEARGELPIAFVEADANFEVAALLETLRSTLASFKIPKAVYVVDALPRNALGKILKGELRASDAAASGQRAAALGYRGNGAERNADAKRDA